MQSGAEELHELGQSFMRAHNKALQLFDEDKLQDCIEECQGILEEVRDVNTSELYDMLTFWKATLSAVPPYQDSYPIGLMPGKQSQRSRRVVSRSGESVAKCARRIL